MTRALIAIPHYFARGSEDAKQLEVARRRLNGLAGCLRSLRLCFSARQRLLVDMGRGLVAANDPHAVDLDVVICTTGGRHLLDGVPESAGPFRHHPTEARPRLLGFECHAVLRDALGGYDYYAYMEDDLVVGDPLLFSKARWFTDRFGDENLLQPERYEVADRPDFLKLYIDGDLPLWGTAPFRDVREWPELRAQVMGETVTFRPALNPHAGCFFLNAEQMRHWASRPWFLDRDTRFVGPLESAATLGIFKTFRIYKPAPSHAGFFELQHRGQKYLSMCLKLMMKED